MALSGSLQTLSLAEIFQTMARTSARGVLRLHALHNACDVVFAQGQIVQFHDNRAEASPVLLQRLQAMGFLSELEASGETFGRSGGYRAIMQQLAAGHQDAQVIREALDGLLFDQLLELFTWSEASFTFVEEGQDPEVDTALVEAEQSGFSLSGEALVEESTRRLDAWHAARAVLPNVEAVLVPAEGAEDALVQAAVTYPDNTVVPLIDGVRSLEDIIRDAVCTRLDAWLVLGDLLRRELIVALDATQMRRFADAYREQGDLSAAAALYRRVLGTEASSMEVVRALGECLEHIGEGPEAAACYRQLALSLQEKGRAAEALAAARQAVALVPPPAQREYRVLIRCLKAQGQEELARKERLQLVQHLLDSDYWDQARGELLEHLEHYPDDTLARHYLALAAGRDDAFKGSDQDVVCMVCGTHARRGSGTVCTLCGASLEIPCAWCERTVAISDQLCFVCGHSAHVPRTDVEHSNAWTAIAVQGDEIRTKIVAACAAVEQGDIERALAIWKEIVELRPEQTQYRKQVRDLEMLRHDAGIERQIAQANEAARRRQYGKAGALYRNALACLAEHDPRRARLQQRIVECKGARKRHLLLYGAALVLIGIAAVLLAREELAQKNFRRKVEARLAEAQQLATQTQRGMDAYQQLIALREELSAEAATLGKRAAMEWMVINEIIAPAAEPMAEADFALIEEFLHQRKAERAAQHLARVAQVYGVNFKSARQLELEERVQKLRETLAQEQERLKRDPERLQQTQQLERDQRYSEALLLAKALAQSPQAEVAAEASLVVQRLTQQQRAREEAKAQVLLAIQHDHARAKNLLVALKTQEHWGDGAEVQSLEHRLAANQDAAAQAFAAAVRSQSTATWQAFLQQYPGSAQVAEARQALAACEADAQRFAQLQQAVVRARQAGDRAAWHAHALALIAAYPQARSEVEIPVDIRTPSPGAVVVWADDAQHELGRTPLQLALSAAREGNLEVRQAGAEPVTLAWALVQQHLVWDCQPSRATVWQVQQPQVAQQLVPWDAGALALGVTAWSSVGWGGQRGFGITLPRQSRELGSLQRARARVCPGLGLTVLEDERFQAFDRQGRLLVSTPLTEAAVEAPVLYRNELFGPQLRVAWADSALRLGALGEQISSVTLPAAAVCGPLAVAQELGVLLLVVDQRGRLHAVEDSSRRLVWSFDLDATQVESPQLLAPGVVVLWMDEQHALALAVDSSGARPLWQVNPGSLRRAPRVQDQRVVLCEAERLVVLDAQGQEVLSLAGTAVAASVHGDRVVWADTQGVVRLQDQRGVRWTWTAPSAVTDVLWSGDQVWVTSADGRISGLAP